MDKDRIITNIEGLSNPTILQTLEAMKDYIITHAVMGPQGQMGFTGPKGEPGNGIVKIENTGSSVGNDYTITHVECEMTDGTTESLDFYAQNGTATLPEVPLDAPPTAEFGNLTQAQFAQLANPRAYITHNNEIYYAADRGHESGYYTYVHNGVSNNGQVFAEKAITINTNNLSWVLTTAKAPSTEINIYAHDLYITFQTYNGDCYAYFTLYTDSSTPMDNPDLDKFPKGRFGLCGATYLKVLGSTINIVFPTYLEVSSTGGTPIVNYLTFTTPATTEYGSVEIKEIEDHVRPITQI